MTCSNDMRINRHIAAAEQLLRQEPDPEFANDGASVLVTGGDRLTARDLDRFAVISKHTRADVVYLEFDGATPQAGPRNVVVMGERGGIVYRWSRCDLWAPEDGGPLLIMPHGLRVCFGYDGIALISMQQRPTADVGAGIALARQRLSAAERTVSAEQIDRVVNPGQPMAA